jgi:hypothetical protein
MKRICMTMRKEFLACLATLGTTDSNAKDIRPTVVYKSGGAVAPCNHTPTEKCMRLLTGFRLFHLLKHFEDAFRGADEHALEGFAEATAFDGVAAGSGAFGHDGSFSKNNIN